MKWFEFFLWDGSLQTNINTYKSQIATEKSGLIERVFHMKQNKKNYAGCLLSSKQFTRVIAGSGQSPRQAL